MYLLCTSARAHGNAACLLHTLHGDCATGGAQDSPSRAAGLRLGVVRTTLPGRSGCCLRPAGGGEEGLSCLVVGCSLLVVGSADGARAFLFILLYFHPHFCVPFTILLPPMLIKLVPSPANARLTNSAVSDKSKTGEASCQR